MDYDYCLFGTKDTFGTKINEKRGEQNSVNIIK